MIGAAPQVSVIISTHNPHPERFARTLAALRQQRFDGQWELIVVDNASTPAVSIASVARHAFAQARIVQEPELGLTSARRRGLREAVAAICVLVDDDNVLSANYLATVAAVFGLHSRLGCAGGKSLPEFETPPPAWASEFFSLLALRDLGNTAQQSAALPSTGNARSAYPDCAPIGAGMAIRREAAESWLKNSETSGLSDRRGSELSSAGDNDIVFSILRAGWSVGYFPELQLTHLIPAERLRSDYLARLNEGVQESWMRVLRRHDANPWPRLSPFGASLRKGKAWFAHRAWRGESHYIRWCGACGHFSGRVN